MASLASSPTKIKRRDSFSLETKEIDRIANMDLSFIENIHVRAPPVNEEELVAAENLKQAIMNLKQVIACDDLDLIAPVISPANLQRILRARKYNHSDALELAEATVVWRIERRPDLLRGTKDIEIECCTGKARLGPDFDRHGRPMLLLDSSAENTKDADKQILHLEWQMERIMRRMESSPNNEVEKNVVFINLENFSIWNSPSMKNTKRTVDLFSKYFCERMGHGICWQPPFYFSVFLRSVKPFVDPVTYGKVVIIKGPYEEGSVNDQKMTLLIGKDWREKCQIEGKKQNKISSPGYNHETYWPAAIAEENEYFAAKKRIKDAALVSTEDKVVPSVVVPVTDDKSDVKSQVIDKCKLSQVEGERKMDPSIEKSACKTTGNWV
jgi:hypothetical protein